MLCQCQSPLLACIGMEHASGDDVAVGNVTGRTVHMAGLRIVTITAAGDWNGDDWDAVTDQLDANDDYIDSDFLSVNPEVDQWTFTYWSQA